jgi:transcriptional regulator with XRE-family HTH domain
MGADLHLLGQVIREQRERRQLSQEGLASLAHISRTYLGEVERGQGNVSIQTLEAIIDGLGINLREFFEIYESRRSDTYKNRA